MLRIGLIGCGMMGTMHANCYKNMKDATLVAVADLRREKAEEIAAGTNAQIYADGMDLIAAAEVDIIDICLPTFLHAKYALAAMDKVKYVFVEKPVALTAAEGDALIAKAKETGAQVQVGQVIRFWDEYVELKKILDSGAYGELINANFRRISPRPIWGWENWLLDVNLSGGAGQDLHIHDIDYALSLFGEPQKFYSIKNSRGEQNSYVNTLMQYEGFAVTVEGTWDLPGAHPFEATFRAVFENATVEKTADKFMLYDKDGAREIVIEKEDLKGEAYAGGNVSDLGGYYKELCYFCGCAAAGAPVEKATLADAVASLKFLLRELAF